MSQTLSDSFRGIINASIIKETYEAIPTLSQRGQWEDLGFLEAWLKESEIPLRHFQECLEKLVPLLSKERVMQIGRSDEVLVFCAHHSLIKCLGIAEELIKRHFPTVDEISFSLESDPETSDEWVSVDVVVAGEIERVVEWEDNYVKEWVSSVPYPERDKIRLLCDIT